MDEPGDQPEKKKRRMRRPASPPALQFPVEATIAFPGQKEPRKIGALWVRREPGALVFGLPEFERPYMQRTLRIPDSAGAIVEVCEISFQQMQPGPPPQPHVPQQPWEQPRPQSAGGPGAVLRFEQGGGMPPPQMPPLRSALSQGGPPASEVHDENGNRIVVPAAFGLAVP